MASARAPPKKRPSNSLPRSPSTASSMSVLTSEKMSAACARGFLRRRSCTTAGAACQNPAAPRTGAETTKDLTQPEDQTASTLTSKCKNEDDSPSNSKQSTEC